MKIRHTFHYVCIVVLIAALLTCGGVSATWTFCNQTIAPASNEWGATLGAMDWTGSDILPDDGSTGEKHSALIQMMLNGTITDENGNVTNIGLNSDNSYITNEIKDRSNAGWFSSSDTLGSMDFWEASDINKYFNTSTENVSFVLYFPDGVSDTYYLYTTSVALEQNDSPTVAIGNQIYPIYETVLKKNDIGVFEAVKTTLGYAKSAYYDNRITGGLLRVPSFDPSTFTEGELGHTTGTAIWTYKGQSTTTYPTSATSPIYHRVKPSSATTYTVTTMMGARVYVLDQNLNEVTVTEGAQGSVTVTFSATANRTYYFKFEGAEAIAFEIT